MIDIQNAPTEQVPITANFTASASSTLVIFGGFNIPTFSQATYISITDVGGGVNLIQPTWTFTPAPVGSWADTLVPTFEFGGIYPGSYDLFSQSIPTASGIAYNLSFLFTQDWDQPPSPPGPNGFKVTVDETLAQVEAESATPEPATWAMMLAGFGLIGLALRRAGNQGTAFGR